MLWFPLASETFIFKEVENLQKLGMDISIFTMYGKSLHGLSEQMIAWQGKIRRYGIKETFRIWNAFFRSLTSRPALTWQLMKEGLFRKMRNFESLGENTWCFMSGFLLAEDVRKNGISLIHSAWANGPATAAWVASRLSGVPFAFTGRAGDIYPEDGLLKEKARDAKFVRTNNAANVNWLKSFCPAALQNKVKLVYNGLTFSSCAPERKPLHSPPYKLLAVGRFARTKGFPELFTAVARLKREHFPITLTLIGDGAWKARLLKLRKRLGLEKIIDMPGFVPNDQLFRHMRSHDLLVVPSVVHSNGDRDGIPNVIMEASCCGLPVVATDVCGIAEVIQNGKTGWLVPQRDPAALARAIRDALENPDRAQRYAQNAFLAVKQMFDPQKNDSELMDLYLKAAENPGV